MLPIAIAYRVSKDYENAKEAFEKASKGQEMISSYPHFNRLWSILYVLFDFFFCVVLYFCNLYNQIRPWDAARHMESAAVLAKELGKWNEVADFYRRASELYVVCGRPQPASDALAKGAR